MRALTLLPVPADDEDTSGRGIEIVDLSTGETTGALCLGEALEHIAHAWISAGPPLSAWPTNGDRYAMLTPDQWRARREGAVARAVICDAASEPDFGE